MDADGRRTWGTFSGNRYWVGDVDQCREMEKGFTEWRKNDGLRRGEELPPFHVSVNSVNFALDIFKPGLNGVIVIKIRANRAPSSSICRVNYILMYAHSTLVPRLTKSRSDYACRSRATRGTSRGCCALYKIDLASISR